ncbi:MAG: hypothetical protein IJX50_04555 [Clostridia bacterium]|nr:hypothetical protein [Clostridia bacterium]
MDFEKEISKALSDPDIMNKVQGVLSSLNNNEEKEEEESRKEASKLPTNMLSSLGGMVNDDRTRLLMAIKPFLSEKRAPYMDSALTILKFASMGKLGKDLKLF